jgi:hypothetical protein
LPPVITLRTPLLFVVNNARTVITTSNGRAYARQP